MLAGSFDPAWFPLSWNPWAWLAVLPTQLAVWICVSLVWRSSPNNHSSPAHWPSRGRHIPGLVELSSLWSWTISKLTWPRSFIASVACTNKLCSSPAKLLSALADKLSSDSGAFNTTQPAFITLLCRQENFTSRDLELRDNFPQISSLIFGTTSFLQFAGLKYLPVVSLYWSSPSFFKQQTFDTFANFLFTGLEVRSCESSNDSWLDSSPCRVVAVVGSNNMVSFIV